MEDNFVESINTAYVFQKVIDPKSSSNPKKLPRIGICGSQGTGKTTLARALSNELQLPLIEEAARTVLGLGFPLDKQGGAESQTAIWLAQLVTQTEQENGFISDRTLLDSWAFLPLIAERTKDPNDLKYSTALLNATIQLMPQHYDVILYLPVEFPPENDGVRETSVEFQLKQDESLRKGLSYLFQPVIEIKGSSEERLSSAIEDLNNLGMVKR